MLQRLFGVPLPWISPLPASARKPPLTPLHGDVAGAGADVDVARAHFFDFNIAAAGLDPAGPESSRPRTLPEPVWKRSSPVRRASCMSPDPASRSTLPLRPSTF